MALVMLYGFSRTVDETLTHPTISPFGPLRSCSGILGVGGPIHSFGRSAGPNRPKTGALGLSRCACHFYCLPDRRGVRRASTFAILVKTCPPDLGLTGHPPGE